MQLDKALSFLEFIPWKQLTYAFLLLFVGHFICKRISIFIGKLTQMRFSKHHALLISRFVYYGLFLLFVVSALNQLGFKLTILLGAAGVFTVALSFASQTAASNLISGIFLLFEQPFKVGDLIAFKDIKGTVETIDWLSTKIRTGDNRLVRIPNEGLIKSEITNLSTFPQKQDEIILRVEASHNIAGIKVLLKELCDDCTHVLSDPATKILTAGFIGNGGVELRILYWSKHDLAMVRDELLVAIKNTFEQESIHFVPERGFSDVY